MVSTLVRCYILWEYVCVYIKVVRPTIENLPTTNIFVFEIVSVRKTPEVTDDDVLRWRSLGTLGQCLMPSCRNKYSYNSWILIDILVLIKKYIADKGTQHNHTKGMKNSTKKQYTLKNLNCVQSHPCESQAAQKDDNIRPNLDCLLI